MVLRSMLALFGVWRLPRPPLGRSSVPLGARVAPAGAPVAESWFVGTPPLSQNELIFGLLLHHVLIENA